MSKAPSAATGATDSGERCRVEDLRTDVHVQPAHRDPVAALDAGDQLRGGGWREAELGALVSGHDVRVHVGRDAGNDPHEDVLVAAGRDELLEPVHVIGPVDHHEPDTVPHGQCELVDPFRISVQHDPGRIDARLERRADLATACHVETEPLLHHHPLDRGAGEGFRGEDDPRVGPARRELGPVLAGSADAARTRRRSSPGCRTPRRARRRGSLRWSACRRRRRRCPAGGAPAAAHCALIVPLNTERRESIESA